MLTAFGSAQAGAGAIDGPLAVDNYKRAVYRAPPARFIVDMLPPCKQGSQYSFGMKITPLIRGDRSSTSSSGSSTTNVEYEVWRRWEDCLWFQDTLELEYSRLARMKRQRLLAGKGVKKDGLYLQDKASSWESLPPGPEPNSVAQNLHDIIPKLTKKGTIFRTSPATIEQRQSELTALVEALFSEDVPTLLQELRADRIVTDFFGYWRRDHDLALKNESHSPTNKSPKPRSSMTSSVLSSYFASSIHSDNTDAESLKSASATSNSPTSPSFRTGRVSVSTEAYRYARATRMKDKQKAKDVPPKRKHTSSISSTTSSSSSSSSQSRNSSSSMTSSIPGVREEVPLTFDHNPQVQSQKDRGLQSLPEDTVLPIHSDSESVPPSIRRPKKRSSRDTLYRRSARIFTAPPRSIYDGHDGTQTPTAAQWGRGIRDSWQSTASASTYLEGLDISFPTSPAHIHHPSRLSIGSIATFMTDSSADAVIPRSDVRPTTTMRPRRSRPASIRTVSHEEGPWSDGDEDILDAYLFDAFPMPSELFPPRASSSETDKDNATEKHDDSSSASSESRPETPLGHLPIIPTSPLGVEIPSDDSYRRQSLPEDVYAESFVSKSPTSPSSVVSFFDPGAKPVPPSPTTSVTSTADSSYTVSTAVSASSAATSVNGTGKSLTIKAAHNKSIILLRTTRETEFAEVRKKIYDKFLSQEKITLTDAFAIALVIPEASGGHRSPTSPNGKSSGARARSSSVGSSGHGGGGGGGPQMILVTNQVDWERALSATDSAKITVRVLDTFHE